MALRGHNRGLEGVGGVIGERGVSVRSPSAKGGRYGKKNKKK